MFRRLGSLILKIYENLSIYSNFKLEAEDFHKFDLILGFDKDNIKNLERLKPANSNAEIKLVNYFNDKKKNTSVADPWYPDTLEAFETVYQDCYDSSKQILEKYK